MRTTLKLVLPLIISVALVSLLFAAYQVRVQRKNLRTDLSRRAELLAESLQEAIEPLFEKNDRTSDKAMQRVVDRFAQREHMKGIAVYEADKNPRVMTSSLGDTFKQAPPPAVAKRSIELLVDAAELERRRAALRPAAAPDEARRGYAWLFNETIMQADEGCDFDFMQRTGKQTETG